MFTHSLSSVSSLIEFDAAPASRLIVLAGSEEQCAPLVIRSLAAQSAQEHRIGVVVGHNRFDLYGLARLVIEQGLSPAPLLARIQLSRAFTCHQLHRRILTLPVPERRWARLYVLGLLDTFYDEDVRYPEVSRLLNESMAHLRRLADASLPVLITVAPPRVAGRERLLKLVAARADLYWELSEQIALPTPQQLSLPMP